MFEIRNLTPSPVQIIVKSFSNEISETIKHNTDKINKNERRRNLPPVVKPKQKVPWKKMHSQAMTTITIPGFKKINIQDERIVDIYLEELKKRQLIAVQYKPGEVKQGVECLY